MTQPTTEGRHRQCERSWPCWRRAEFPVGSSWYCDQHAGEAFLAHATGTAEAPPD